MSVNPFVSYVNPCMGMWVFANMSVCACVFCHGCEREDRGARGEGSVFMTGGGGKERAGERRGGGKQGRCGGEEGMCVERREEAEKRRAG